MSFVMKENDLIVGIHSIVAALENKNRSNHQLFATKDGLDKLKKHLKSISINEDVNVICLDLNNFNVKAQKLFKERFFEFNRISSQLLLLSSPLALDSVSELIKKCQKCEQIKLLALDNVTDIHNGAAILRTAAFYGVDALILAIKGNFTLTPSFYRIASGATEYVKIVVANNLSRSINELQKSGVECIGLFEQEQTAMSGDEGELQSLNLKKRCMVLGNEENGISHAVARILEKRASLSSLGAIKSLNVSVAAALAMERFLKY